MIEPLRIDQITQIVERAGLNEQTLAALRQSFADLHFTYCMDEDIGVGTASAHPVRESEGVRIYMVDGRGHCMHFTTDLDAATGLVLAEVESDGED